MLAKAIPGILPKLTNAEKVELTRTYLACGELKSDGKRSSLGSVNPTPTSAYDLK
jgi:hypothetical protein